MKKLVSTRPLTKTLLFILIACVLPFTETKAKNDEHFIIGLAPQIGWLTGTSNKTNGIGLGGRNDLQFYLTEKLRLTAAFGGIFAFVGVFTNEYMAASSLLVKTPTTANRDKTARFYYQYHQLLSANKNTPVHQ